MKPETFVKFALAKTKKRKQRITQRKQRTKKNNE